MKAWLKDFYDPWSLIILLVLIVFTLFSLWLVLILESDVLPDDNVVIIEPPTLTVTPTASPEPIETKTPVLASTPTPSPVPTVTPTVTPDAPNIVIHKIRAGDTLSGISMEYYGIWDRWPEIWDATNVGAKLYPNGCLVMIPDPHWIDVGNCVLVPVD